MTKNHRAIGLLILFLVAGTFLFSQTEDAAKLFEQNKEGVLFLYVYGGNKELIAKGVGFGLSQDVIITSYHLVSMADEVEGVNYKGKKMKVEGIVAVDKNLDVALLKVKGKVMALPVGNSDEVQQGARIFALGANETGDLIISEGTVRTILKLSETQPIIETSLAIPEGFNGGPMLDLKGQAVGLTLILDNSGRIGMPSNSWNGLPKMGKTTPFKDWTKEDYFVTFEGAFLAGRVFSLIDDLGNAKKYLEKVVKLNPSTVEAYALLASVYSKQRDYTPAASAYNKVIELDPKRADAYFGLGDIYFRMQRWTDAIAALEKGVSFDSSRKETLFTIGNAYEELRDFAKAADAYEKYLNSKPENPWTGYLRLGSCRMELAQYDQAVAALEQALKAQPQDVNVNYRLAQAYEKAGQLKEAQATYENLVALNPGDAATYYGLIVRMYDGAGQYDNAIEAAKKVIELNPKSEIAVYNLGIMYLKLDRCDEAIVTFKQALAIRPDYDYAYYNIGLCYSKQKKWKESIDAFKNFVALAPDNADAWLNIGIGYMQLKNFDSALEPLKKCVELRPDYGVALFNLAIVYLNLKDNFSARDVYKTLVTVDPALAERLKKFLR
jgi:tetratricopeptide (TPR) repeat protein